jgi:sulfur relay (sulfurtransferase) complex TusBCD TusD component (DsrE family)
MAHDTTRAHTAGQHGARDLRRHRALQRWAAAAALAICGLAQAATVNFDSVAADSVIDTLFSTQGVTFSALPGQSRNNDGHVYVRRDSYARSQPNALGLSTGAFAYVNDADGYIKASFTQLQRTVSIDVAAIVVAEFATAGTLPPYITAYGARDPATGRNPMLEMLYYSAAAVSGLSSTKAGPWQTLTISRPTADIQFIVMSSPRVSPASPNAYGVFDNLVFSGDGTAPEAGYQGCFTDDATRALPVQLMPGGATPQSCIAAARSAGYAYAGVQYRGSCFAGNRAGYAKVPDAECNAPCDAASGQICGGSWRNSVYVTGLPVPAVPAPAYQGCYSDDAVRALPVELMASGATVERCAAAAQARGLRFAGLQFKGQCFGGNTLGKVKVAEGECNTRCTADAGQTCGGTWRNSVWATGVTLAAPPVAGAYQGCYVDDANRALPVALMSSGATVASCVAAAKAAGYTYAGVQFQGQCYAGNSIGRSKVADSECNTPCTAHPADTCGGGWRNSIYQAK